MTPPLPAAPVTDEDRLPGEQLVVALDGFEGPLDLLLALARTQKLDLSKMSMLELAEQYIDFIDAARAIRLEIAADYLVMAAWLAFLKSKLLLPAPPAGEEATSGHEMALNLAHRLNRLAAMRQAVEALGARQQLGQEMFARGMPEGGQLTRTQHYYATAFDLLKAYAEQRRKTAQQTVQWGARSVWSIRDARERLEKLIGRLGEWAPLDAYLTEYLGRTDEARTAVASSFGATLELTREGHLQLAQASHFGPLLVRWLAAEAKPRRMAVGE